MPIALLFTSDEYERLLIEKERLEFEKWKLLNILD